MTQGYKAEKQFDSRAESLNGDLYKKCPEFLPKGDIKSSYPKKQALDSI